MLTYQLLQAWWIFNGDNCISEKWILCEFFHDDSQFLMWQNDCQSLIVLILGSQLSKISKYQSSVNCLKDCSLVVFFVFVMSPHHPYIKYWSNTSWRAKRQTKMTTYCERDHRSRAGVCPLLLHLSLWSLINFSQFSIRIPSQFSIPPSSLLFRIFS